MDIDIFREAVRQAWSAETSASPHQWLPDNAAWGQCAVTALIVQDYFGGELLRCTINDVSHYWNKLPDGTEVDLTREQFSTISSETAHEPRTREYVVSFPETVQRYDLLRKHLQRRLGYERSKPNVENPK